MSATPPDASGALLDQDTPDTIRLSVAEATALGERALWGLGLPDDRVLSWNAKWSKRSQPSQQPNKPWRSETMPARMTDQEVKAFLDAKPGWIVLSTIGREGYPHSVPLGYFRLGDDVYIGCRAGTQKIKNIERNPKVSLVLESGSSRQDLKGVMIQGHATVHTDPETALRLSREAARLRGGAEDALPREPRPGVADIQVQPKRIISWDYSRDADAT